METPEKNGLVPPELFPLPANWSIEEWNKCEDDLYSIFMATLVNKPPLYRGIRIAVRREPIHKGKHATFWHLISEGEKERERTPDLSRCERLGWVNWVISNCDLSTEICWFENRRGTEKCVVLWYRPQDYVVILGERKGYFILKTAYIIKPHRKISLQREYDEFRRNRP